MKRLSLIYEIAFRLIQERSGLLGLISKVSIFGVFLGVLALVVVTSVVNGFQNELMKTIAGTQGDVLFYTRSTPIRDPEILEEKIKSFVPDLQAITRTFVSEVMMSGPNGAAGSVLEGVDLETWKNVVDVDEQIESGKLPENENEIVLGKSLAKTLGVQVGDAVQVVVPFSGEDDDSGLGAPRSQSFIVSGIVHFGMNDYDSKYSYCSLSTLQTFLEQPNQITTYRIKLENSANARTVANELSDHFSFPYRVKDWSQLNKNLLYAISVEKTVIAVLMTAILIVATFNVISALFMMVFEREAEISMLRVLGMRKQDLFMLFTFIGASIGSAGTALGIFVGAIAMLILKYTKIIALPADVYRLEYLPVVIRGSEWGLIALLAFVICLLATIIPALKVANRIPVEGLKWSQ